MARASLRGLTGFVGLAFLVMSGVASAQDARALFQQGQESYRLGQYEDAIDAWERAYALDARPGLQYNLAQAYGRLGRVEEEQQALTIFVERSGASGDPEQLELARARLVALGDRIRRTGMQLTGVPSDAQVVIDDAPIARDDDGNYAVPLDPGPHRVLVTAPGFEEFSHSVVVRAGESVVVPVMLDRAEPAPVAADDADSRGGAARTLGIASLVVGGSALAVGGTFGLLALRESDGVYRGSSAADRAEKFALISDITLGVGAALAVTGLVLVIVGRPDDDEAPRALVVPRLTRDGAGALLVGRF